MADVKRRMDAIRKTPPRAAGKDAPPAVTPIAGHGGEDDRQEPRPRRSGCRRGPRSTSRSSPRVPQLAPSEPELRPRPAGRAQREHRVPGSRSSTSARAGRPRARRPRATPGRGRTPPRDRPAGRTPGRWPGPAGHGRSGGCGPGRWGAGGSGCLERPRHYSSTTLSDPGGLKRTRAVREHRRVAAFAADDPGQRTLVIPKPAERTQRRRASGRHKHMRFVRGCLALQTLLRPSLRAIGWWRCRSGSRRLSAVTGHGKISDEE